jgi:hypothetical protein
MLNAGVARRHAIEMIEATEEEVLQLPEEALSLLDSLIQLPGVEVWPVERRSGLRWRIGIAHQTPCVTTLAPQVMAGYPRHF